MFRFTHLKCVRLGPRIQAHALMSSYGQALLRANTLLGTATWDQVLANCPEARLCVADARCFIENLTRRRVERLLRAGDRLERMLSADALWDLDWAIARSLHRCGPSARMIEPLRRCARLLPITCAAVLRGPAPRDLKAELARHAYASYRLLWLATEEAEGLGDEEVWDLAVNGKALPATLEHTLFADHDVERSGHMRAQLLYVRPSLIDRALASNDERWWVAAGMVPLTPTDQDRLRVLTEAHWRPGDRHWLDRLFGVYDAAVIDPMVLVARGPWCTEENLAFVIERHGAKRSQWGIEIENPKWSFRSYPLRSGRRFETTRSVADLDEETLCRWLDVWPVHPFVTAESLRRPLAGAAARARRAQAESALTTIPAVLWRYGRRFEGSYAKRRPEFGWWWEFTAIPPPSTPQRSALGDSEPIGMFGTDHGAGRLEGAELTDHEFEVAFSLWVDPANAALSVGELVACAKGVLAGPTSTPRRT